MSFSPLYTVGPAHRATTEYGGSSASTPAPVAVGEKSEIISRIFNSITSIPPIAWNRIQLCVSSINRLITGVYSAVQKVVSALFSWIWHSNKTQDYDRETPEIEELREFKRIAEERLAQWEQLKGQGLPVKEAFKKSQRHYKPLADGLSHRFAHYRHLPRGEGLKKLIRDLKQEIIAAGKSAPTVGL